MKRCKTANTQQMKRGLEETDHLKKFFFSQANCRRFGIPSIIYTPVYYPIFVQIFKEFVGKILDCVAAVSRSCDIAGVPESSWHLIRWLIRCGWAMTSLQWRIQISKDYELISGKVGKDDDVQDMIALRKTCELVLDTSKTFSSVEVPPECAEEMLHVRILPQVELFERFNSIAKHFSGRSGRE
jgi:hypothetical protein